MNKFFFKVFFFPISCIFSTFCMEMTDNNESDYKKKLKRFIEIFPPNNPLFNIFIFNENDNLNIKETLSLSLDKNNLSEKACKNEEAYLSERKRVNIGNMYRSALSRYYCGYSTLFKSDKFIFKTTIKTLVKQTIDNIDLIQSSYNQNNDKDLKFIAIGAGGGGTIELGVFATKLKEKESKIICYYNDSHDVSFKDFKEKAIFIRQNANLNPEQIEFIPILGDFTNNDKINEFFKTVKEVDFVIAANCLYYNKKEVPTFIKQISKFIKKNGKLIIVATSNFNFILENSMTNKYNIILELLKENNKEISNEIVNKFQNKENYENNSSKEKKEENEFSLYSDNIFTNEENINTYQENGYESIKINNYSDFNYFGDQEFKLKLNNIEYLKTYLYHPLSKILKKLRKEKNNGIDILKSILNIKESIVNDDNYIVSFEINNEKNIKLIPVEKINDNYSISMKNNARNSIFGSMFILSKKNDQDIFIDQTFQEALKYKQTVFENFEKNLDSESKLQIELKNYQKENPKLKFYTDDKVNKLIFQTFIEENNLLTQYKNISKNN